MDLSSAFPTFFITLREGVEAALVVGIVLACLSKANQSQLNLWVYSGIGAGLGGSLLIGIIFAETLEKVGNSTSPYAPVIKESLEAVFCLGAVVLLSWMLVWMTQQARSLKTELEGAVKTALIQGGGWGIFSLVVIAVLREGFETVIFITAQLQGGWIPTLGAVAGIIGAVIIGFLLFKGGVKINLRLFFQTMGIVLLLIVSGLVVSFLNKVEAIAGMMIYLDSQYATLCWGETDSCLLGLQVWNASQILPEKEFPGILLKAFLGYRQQLYLVQAVSYVLFLCSVGWLYLKSLRSAT